MVPNPLKIDLWSGLGALWAPSWRQDDPRVAPRAKIDEKYSILGWPVGSKMEPKSVKNLIKIRLDFCNDFESTFSRSWVGFGSKNLSKMRGLRVTFSSLLRICEKCDFEQTLLWFCCIFRLSEGRFSILKGVFFMCFFKAASETYFLMIWGEF